MSFIDAARHRLRSLFRAGAADRERAEELRFHQDLAAEHIAHETGNAEDAPYASRRSFGNTTYFKEEMRQMSALRWVDATRQDLRFAWRTFGRAPVFTIVVVLSIGLGMPLGSRSVCSSTCSPWWACCRVASPASSSRS